MRTCPFCGAVVDPDSRDIHYNPILEEWVLTHFCDPAVPSVTVSVCIYGKNKQEVIDRWNGSVPNE